MDATECELLQLYYDRLQFVPPDFPPAVTNDTAASGGCDKATNGHLYHITVRAAFQLCCVVDVCSPAVFIVSNRQIR